MSICKIGICDDEAIYIKQMKEIIKDFSQENAFPVEIFEYESSQHLIAGQVSLDLLFLDIEMKEQNGIALKNMLEASSSNCKIIFVTNYENRIKEAFGKNVVAFINKKDMTMIKKYLTRLMNEYNAHKIFCVGDRQIDLFDVIYIMADGSYSHIITRKKNYVYCIYLTDMIKRMNDNHMIRCHRSYAVNLRFIKDITSNKVELLNGASIPVSAKYRETLLMQYFAYVREN